ncbi:MAG: histidine phosphotransferase [Roseitalea sp.]|jgi:histidine phosphotransferase ChpT|nr:histidine phosphotransferase [Roseitalea sp.]MBO6723936.1 histidine phosphotransferase [Roseitalea sp.]MBO6741819.1 histidine phosphotransferase [Roseitalea sp.]
MHQLKELAPSELASLLCSRVCHDIISPVGAINNGLELLDDGGADADAMDLIRTSAVNASARLQFARIAFGAAGSAGVEIDTGDAQAVALAFMKGEKADFTWTAERALLPKNQVKLVLNLILVANGSIPRGGTLDCAIETGSGAPVITLRAAGKLMRIPQKFADFLDGRFDDEPIDAHSVQFFYTLLLANEAGMTVVAEMADDAITYTAR